MKADNPLKEYLEEMKKIEGYPHGRDEDILELSDPPHYTACPNPYINEFIEKYGTPYDEETDEYHREPYVGDVSEGKNDPIYNAHSYHTKVPYKAIMKYIEHYTDEGDIVFDGFCGTGMTGVAAQMLNRKAVLSDLSPAATFIAYNYNTPVDIDAFQEKAERILEEVEEECGWMYQTYHFNTRSSDREYLGKGTINYTVWSDVFICPYCGGEIVFWDAAVDKESGKVLKEFLCSACEAEITKKECEKSWVTFHDKSIGQEITQAKQVPVMLNYTFDGKRYEKIPDENDLKLIEEIESLDIPYWYPTYRMPEGYNTQQPKKSHGITHVHHFYTKRNLLYIANVFSHLSKKTLIYWFTSAISRLTKMYKFMPIKKNGKIADRRTGNVSGTFYIPSLFDENTPLILLKRKINDCQEVWKHNLFHNLITTQSITNFDETQNNNIDYIFTDPPFGDNLMYSELNFLWESWLKVFTNNETEAIVNKTQGKSLIEYSELMLQSFKEYYRVLKPKRWITVVFHNSKSSVWNAIQEAMMKAGFVIANVSILDKQQGSFKQVTSTGAVKNDLVISAYKPDKKFENRFLENAGEGMEEDFIRMQLDNLTPTPNIERTEKMLYSKMLSYYLKHGYIVRYDSSEFYEMLRNTFYEADGYWFADSNQLEQYLEYKKKMKLDGIVGSAFAAEKLLVYDEKTAIRWLYDYIEEPKDYSTIYTNFTKISNIAEDDIPELKEMLENNFIFENGKYRRPQSQDEELTVRKKREKELVRDFNTILLEAKNSRKKIKSCRNEALVYGFEMLYQKGKFGEILTVAKQLDKKILERNSEVRDFIEIAEIKTGNY